MSVGLIVYPIPPMQRRPSTTPTAGPAAPERWLAGNGAITSEIVEIAVGLVRVVGVVVVVGGGGVVIVVVDVSVVVLGNARWSADVTFANNAGVHNW